MIKRIAFTGYSRSGKDTAAQPLIAAGYHKVAFGDHIKRQIDDVIQREFGFSAFTQVSSEKQKIRAVLEAWGDANYDRIVADLMDEVRSHDRVVNTRISRRRESELWKMDGGVIYVIAKPGLQAFSAWEQGCMDEIDDLIDGAIFNDGDVDDLHHEVRKTFGLAEPL